MKFLFILLIFVSKLLFAAQPKNNPSFDLVNISVSQVINLIYSESYPEKAYFLEPQILQDQRLVSFRYRDKDGDFRLFLSQFLKNLGYVLEEKNKADFVRSIPAVIPFSLAEDPNIDIYYYRPKFRDGGYLVEMLSSLFKGKFTVQRSVKVDSASSSIASGATASSSDSALGQIQKSLDQILFTGSKKEVEVLDRLLTQIDNDIGQVMVSAVAYEVQTSSHTGSALSLAGSILGNAVNFNVGLAKASDNFVSLTVGGLTAISQVLDSDSRFKVLSNPSVRVASGQTAKFVVGDDVPTLGAVTYNNSGTPNQSIDYRSAGIIFNVSPKIRDSSIDLFVDQQVSNFVVTTNGINNSPTISKRQISTNLSMKDGEVVVIGGLRTSKNSDAKTSLPFLSKIFKSDVFDFTQSEILLFLQLNKI